MFKFIENKSKLIEGYNNRIKSFIFNMISKPYKIQYLESKNNFSFRPEDKTKKGNIILKPFVPDKVRIEKYLKQKQEEQEKFKKNQKYKNKLFLSFDDNDSSINSKNDQRCFSESKKGFKHKEKYLQPIMKFKPRTDLERIFDTINSNYYGKIDRNLINEQLKSLGLVNVYSKKHPKLQNEYSLLREKLKVNPETLHYLIKEKQRLEQGPKTKEIDELISNMENIIHINKEILSEKIQKSFSFSEKSKNATNKRRNLNNFLAKNILSEYQKKTHFKALCAISLDLSDYFNRKKNLNEDKSKDDNKSEEIYTYNSYSNKNLNNKNNKKINLKSNSISLYKRPFHKSKKYPKEQMDYLKNLCSKPTNYRRPFGGIFDYPKKIYDEENEINNKLIRQTNNIIINGKYYNRNDLKGISNAVLNQCNYIKNHYGPENAGDGKTMITRGMTVNEFTQKYNLPK